jgi:4-amino-4-deoxy-L-arabinose transferase-like glycosyltransferase
MKFRAKLMTFLNFSRFTRSVLFILGTGFVVAGYYLMSRFENIEALGDLSTILNTIYRIDVNNLDNVVVGIALIMAGGLLFLLASRHLIFKGSGSVNSEYGPNSGHPNSRLWIVGGISGLLFTLLLIRVLFFSGTLLDTVLWLGSVGLAVVLAIWWDQNRKTPLALNISLSEWALLAVILIVGLFIGTFQLQDVPNALMGDEGNFFETARSIALDQYSPSVFDLGVYTYPVVSSIWQAWILKIFGITLWAWRFGSVLPAVLTSFPLYFLCRETFGRRVGVASALVLVTSPYLLAFSRLGYNNSQSIFVVTLGVWLVFFGQKRASIFYSLLGGMATGLGFLTYTAGRLGLVVTILYLGALLFFQPVRKQWRQFLKTSLFPVIIGWALVAGPHLIYTNQNVPQNARHKMLEGLFIQANYVRELYAADLADIEPVTIEYDEYELVTAPQIYPKLLLRGVVRTLLSFQHEELVTEHFIAGSLTRPYATVFYLLGGFYLLGRLRHRNSLVLILWFASGLFFLSVISTYPPRHAHLVPVIPVMAIMIGLGIHVFVEQIMQLTRPETRLKQILRLQLVGIGVLWLSVVGVRTFFVTMPTVYRPNLEQIVNWVGLHNDPTTQVVYATDDPWFEAWQPYFFRDILPQHAFKVIRSTEIQTGGLNFSPATKIAVFYRPSEENLIAPLLRPVFPDAEELTFFDREQRPIGHAFVQGEIEILPPLSVWGGIWGVVTSPVIWLLFPLVLFVGYYLYRYRGNYPRLAVMAAPPPTSPTTSQSAEIKSHGADPTATGSAVPVLTRQKSPGFIEFGVVFRLRFGNKTRRYESKSSFYFGEEILADDQAENEKNL